MKKKTHEEYIGCVGAIHPKNVLGNLIKKRAMKLSPPQVV